jgi:hypothetical protein
VDTVFDYFDKDRNGVVDWMEFTSATIMLSQGSLTEKLHCTCLIFHIDTGEFDLFLDGRALLLTNWHFCLLSCI